jgi:hypothetical protein
MSQPDTDHPADAAIQAARGAQALVVIGEREQTSRSGEAKRPDAAFLTQILASKAHMGPFRRYRREEPATAMARYAAAASLMDGRVPLKRSA